MRATQRSRRICLLLVVATTLGLTAHAAEHVTLKNGFDMICDHREVSGENTRLYVGAGDDNFVEVTTANIASIDAALPIPAAAAVATSIAKSVAAPADPQKLTPSELHELLHAAGAERNLDVDLLACVVHAESNGQVRAVSRTGARGLMQLMPGTAAQLGVKDSFQPGQNIHGGTEYLNTLLLRYHDNLALALAAYNAGSKAVDRYHGVPPYRETRAYVARIIHEFNQRKLAEAAATSRLQASSNHLQSTTQSTARQN
jgi:soluble lytic murein transglycosylase-like protein